MYFDLDKDNIRGSLSCEIHAENLSTPVKMTVAVEISIKRLKTVDHARRLIHNLAKPTN